MSIILQIWDNSYVISLQVLTEKIKHYNISRFTTDNVNPLPNLNLTLKIFSLKPKTNKILPIATIKIKFCFFKKTVLCSFRL